MSIVFLGSKKGNDQRYGGKQYHTKYDVLQVFNQVRESVSQEMPGHYHDNNPNGGTDNIEDQKFLKIDMRHSRQDGNKGSDDWQESS